MSSKNLERIVEEVGALTLLEVADLVKLMEEKFGVSAAMPVAAAGAAAAAPAAAEAEKSEYKVELLDSGANKIEAIKALRKVKKELGLTDAKKLIESAPVVIAEAASKADAQALKEALEAAGGKVKLS
jgi:large subunit ribosomal protein L7/L12